MKDNKSTYAVLSALSIIGLIGIVIDLFLTRSGPGVSGDAVHYMEGARNLALGNGYMRLRGAGGLIPITHFPPVFSLAMAGLSALGLAPLDGGRLLNAVVFGLSLLLSGWLIWRASRSLWASVLGSWLILVSISVTRIHAWVMAEPLYILLTLLAVYCLCLYLSAGSQPRGWLLLAGLLSGAATLTRYAGFALIGALLLAAGVWSPGSWRKRFQAALLTGAASLLPVILWLLRNQFAAGSAANRRLAFHPFSFDLVLAIRDELAFWIMPINTDLHVKLYAVLFGAFLAACLGGLALLWGLHIHRPASAWPDYPEKQARIHFSDALLKILMIYMPLYLLMLVLNTTFLDASTDVGSVRRYLIPVFVSLVIWAASLFARLGDSGRIWRWATVGILAGGIAFAGLQTYAWVQFVQHPGFVFGYTDIKNLDPGLVSALKGIDPGQAIISNDFEFIYFLAGRPPRITPIDVDVNDGLANQNYQKDMENIRQLLKEGAILVAAGDPQGYPRSLKELLPGLTHLQSYTQADFYIDPQSAR